MIKSAVIFAKCLGLNDSPDFGNHKTNPKNGTTEVIDCLNMTTTHDGAMEKIPGFVNKLTHSLPITNVSAKERLLFQDGANTNEWDGATATIPLPLYDGPLLHTPIDCRVSDSSGNYKSMNNDPLSAVACTVGTNPDPVTSRTFAAMPLFKQGFVYNGKLYVINRDDPRFLQYSEYGHYDLFNLGDGFIPFVTDILQAGGIGTGQKDMLGCLLTMHTEYVTVFSGTNMTDFMARKFSCSPIDGTLYSGFISKALGFGHLFLCSDGVYLVNSDGIIKNLSRGRTDALGSLNTSYTGAIVQNGKYLAIGDTLTIEYDFQTGSVMKRSSFGVASASSWQGDAYLAKGSELVVFDATSDDTADFSASVTFPYSYWGAAGGKSVIEFYLTGIIGGDVDFILTDDNGKTWTQSATNLGRCTNYRIKTPKTMMGGQLSLQIVCTSGAFRLENLKVNFAESARSR